MIVPEIVYDLYRRAPLYTTRGYHRQTYQQSTINTPTTPVFCIHDTIISAVLRYTYTYINIYCNICVLLYNIYVYVNCIARVILDNMYILTCKCKFSNIKGS